MVLRVYHVYASCTYHLANVAQTSASFGKSAISLHSSPTQICELSREEDYSLYRNETESVYADGHMLRNFLFEKIRARVTKVCPAHEFVTIFMKLKKLKRRRKRIDW